MVPTTSASLRWVAGALAALMTVTTLAAEPLAKRDVERLLELAWSTKSDERAEAGPYFDELLERVGSDERLVRAQLLVKIKQRQYAEAVKLVDRLLAGDKPPLDLLRTKVWLSVLLKQFGPASVASERLAQSLPPLADPPGDSEGPNEDLARFLGRVQGFLDGPASESYPEGQRTALRKKVTERLVGERKVAYLEGRDAVLEQYLALIDEKESRREKSREDAERDRDARLTDLDELRNQAAQRSKDLDARKDKLRGELNDELKELQKQDSPLARRFSQLDAQTTALRAEQRLVENDQARYNALLTRERDPATRAFYIRELARLDALWARYDTDIATMTRQAAGVANQRADLDRRAAMARNNVAQQVDSAERELADLNRRLRKADAEERRLRNKNSGENNSGVLAKAAQAAAFTTYEPYPLEEQRQALLELFK